MSRIGKAPIQLPANVSVEVSKGNLVTVKGANSTLTQQVHPDIKVNVEDGLITSCALQNNHVTGPCMVYIALS